MKITHGGIERFPAAPPEGLQSSDRRADHVDMPGWLYQLLVWGQLMELGRGPSDNRGGEPET